MKPLHLNLASRPYRDDRPFYVAVIALVALTGFLLVNNIATAYDYLENTRTTRAEITRIERAIAVENQKAESAEQQIRNVNLQSLNTQTSYINTQIAERAFSWTKLLDALERTVPNDVRLLSLNPAVDEKTGLTSLQLQCVAKDSEGMVKLLRNLITNPVFRGAYPLNETRQDDGTYRFSVSVEYLENATMVTR